jgi:hypothetical protein
MAFIILSRICLLVLLGFDYVCDPWDGTNPFSQPLASTEAYCHSLKASATICSIAVEQHKLPEFGTFAEDVVFPSLLSALVAWTISATDTADLLYVFMSLQR